MNSGQIHQFVHTLSYGDAISSEALALQRVFRELGFASEIYCIHCHPRYSGMALNYQDFPVNFTGEVVLHYSLGSELNKLYENLTGAFRTLIYHNLTPPIWFDLINPVIAKDIRDGVADLPKLCSLSNLLLADSQFNADELINMGFSAKVLSLPVDISRWNVETNSGMAKILKNGGALNFLHIGRFAPNKCLEDIIKIFYFIHHYGDKNSTLWLVGIDIGTELYSFALKRLADELQLTDAIRFTGCLDDSEIKALYENCDTYICMSEHEGFCLPVVEAMHFGLPVITYHGCALEETVDDGGIIVYQKNYAEIANIAIESARNPELRKKLIKNGKARFESISGKDKFQNKVKQLFIDERSAPPSLKSGYVS